jgi:hypothetical protein
VVKWFETLVRLSLPCTVRCRRTTLTGFMPRR